MTHAIIPITPKKTLYTLVTYILTRMKSKTFVVVLSLFAVLGVAGASTYTTADINRTVSVDVAADDSSAIQFNTGTGTQIQNGTLQFNGDGNSLNKKATFVFGDKTSPSSTYAIEAVNADTEGRTGTLNVDYASTTDSDSTGDVTLYVYDSAGNEVGNTSDGTVSTTFDNPVYIVAEVNTDQSGTLDGEIQFTSELN